MCIRDSLYVLLEEKKNIGEFILPIFKEINYLSHDQFRAMNAVSYTHLYIYQLERQIEEQLFSNVPLRVKIIERFYLSRQYTPENFLEVYRPSIDVYKRQV